MPQIGTPGGFRPIFGVQEFHDIDDLFDVFSIQKLPLEVAAGNDVSADVVSVGIQITASLGDEIVSAASNRESTGIQSITSAGEETVSGVANASVSGAGAVTTVNSIELSAKANSVIVGIESIITNGVTSQSAGANHETAGVELSASCGIEVVSATEETRPRVMHFYGGDPGTGIDYIIQRTRVLLEGVQPTTTSVGNPKISTGSNIIQLLVRAKEIKTGYVMPSIDHTIKMNRQLEDAVRFITSL